MLTIKMMVSGGTTTVPVSTSGNATGVVGLLAGLPISGKHTVRNASRRIRNCMQSHIKLILMVAVNKTLRQQKLLLAATVHQPLQLRTICV